MGGYTEIIWLLAGGDITKMKEIYKLNCHEFLYWAAYMIERKVEVARLEKIILLMLNSYAVTTIILVDSFKSNPLVNTVILELLIRDLNKADIFWFILCRELLNW
jgi:hypothetical protein